MKKGKRIELEVAQDLLLKNVALKKRVEQVSLEEALGRVLAKDQYAKRDTPPFNRSPLDGYALRSVDSQAASEGDPLVLKVVETLYAGDIPHHALQRGEASYIMTGAMLPQGADCVIKYEETTREENVVYLRRSLGAWENVVFCGEDVKEGAPLLEKGIRLGPAAISLLAGQGLFQTEVFARPTVAVMATGSELIAPEYPWQEGKIFDSNSHLLSARCRQLHAKVCARHILQDEPSLLLEKLDALLNEAELVVTTGGVSVGEKDYLPQVAAQLGGEVLFHGIYLRPGSPVLALSREGRTLLCLSGNPFAALATFEVLAVPVLKKLSGEEQYNLQKTKAVARTPFAKASPSRRLVRARVEGQNVYIPQAGHASGQLHTLMRCNCLVDISAGSGPVVEGDCVDIFMLE